MIKKLLYIIPVICFTLFAFAAGIVLWRGGDPSALQSPLSGKLLPAFSAGTLSETAIDGPAVINVFASWCAPCEAEHGYLKKLADDGIRLYGLNFMDEPEDRDAFLERLGNPYTAIGDDPEGEAAIALGVFGVPTTFAISADNTIVYRKDGPISAAELAKIREALR